MLKKRRSIHSLITWFGAAIIVGSWIAVLTVIQQDRQLEILRASNETANMVMVLQKHIEATFDQIENTLNSFRAGYESGSGPVEMQQALHRFVMARPDLFNLISIIDADGNVLVTDQSVFKPLYSGDRPYFVYHRDNAWRIMHVGSPVLSRVTGKWYIPVSMRLNDGQGNFSGVLLASVKPEYFSMIFHEVKLGKDSLLYLADTRGEIYSGMVDGKPLQLGVQLRADEIVKILNRNERFTNTGSSSLDGLKRIRSFAFIPDRQMIISVGLSFSDHMRPARNRGIVLLAGQLIITSLLVFFLLRLRQAVQSREIVSRELEETRRNMELALEANHMSFYNVDCLVRTVVMSPGLFVDLGYQADEIPGSIDGLLSLVHPGEQSVLSDFIAGKLDQDVDRFLFESRVRKHDGSWCWVSMMGYVQERSDDARPLSIAGVAWNVTEKHLSASALRESEERARFLFENMTQGVVFHDLSGAIIHANQAAATILGLDMEQLLGKTSFDPRWHAIHEDGSAYPGETHPAMCTLLSGKAVHDAIMGIFNPRIDEYVWARVNSIPRYNHEGQLSQVVVTIEDITARKAAERALKASEERLDLAMGVANDGLWDWNLVLNTVYYDRRYYTMAGYEPDEYPQEFSEWEKRVHPDDLPLVRKVIDEHINGDRDLFDVDFRFLRKNGSWMWLRGMGKVVRRDDQGRAIRMVGTHTDITGLKEAEADREKLQAQLVQAQKMESVGRLAGGVAHDFNNMLGVILGHAELAMDGPNEDEVLSQHLHEIKAAAERSANLTRQLLAFARKQTVSPQTLDLNRTVEGMLRMLHRLIGEEIDFGFVPGNAAIVRMDPSQLDQVLVNLCVNARDSIAGAGSITIETGVACLDDEFCSVHPGFVPGSYALLVVEDSGKGMSRDILDHLFEPFFTTKEVGKGTGLGLATVYGIVKQNDGFIDVQSEKGEGTRFSIYLPLSGSDESLVLSPSVAVSEETGGTILLVEDEDMILEIVRTMLAKLGYNVISASSPFMALEIARENQNIDLLITDVVMPGMNGRELVAEAEKFHPGLRKIFMSGYTADVIAEHGVLEDGLNFIQKPFSVNELADKVMQVMSFP